MKKLTKENYKTIIRGFLNNTDIDDTFIYHHSYISENDLYDYSFDNGVLIEIESLNGPFKTVKFKSLIK